jgi:hypothetical protein
MRRGAAPAAHGAPPQGVTTSDREDGSEQRASRAHAHRGGPRRAGADGRGARRLWQRRREAWQPVGYARPWLRLHSASTDEPTLTEQRGVGWLSSTGELPRPSALKLTTLGIDLCQERRVLCGQRAGRAAGGCINCLRMGASPGEEPEQPAPPWLGNHASVALDILHHCFGVAQLPQNSLHHLSDGSLGRERAQVRG